MAIVLKSAESVDTMTVEASSLAARVTPRGFDYTGLGVYALHGTSGNMAAGLAAAALVYEFPWLDHANLALVRSLTISAGNSATAFTAGVVKFVATINREESSSTSGGTALLNSRSQRLRSSMAPPRLPWTRSTGSQQVRISNTSALGANTSVVDIQAVGSVVRSVQGTAGEIMVAPFTLVDGFYMPVALQAGESLTINATVPATGTWNFAVGIIWAEMPVSQWSLT